MFKIAYIFDSGNLQTFAGKTIARGFKNALLANGDECVFFDSNQLSTDKFNAERRRLVQYDADFVFTSVENIHSLPQQLNGNTKLVLWGQFYDPCSYEPQIHHLLEPTKRMLQQLSKKFDILIWSQHDDAINERFFSGYQKELGLKFVQLLHAADQSTYVAPNDETSRYDFMWVGNIGHRKQIYDAFVAPLKHLTSSYLDFNEHNRVDPEIIDFNQLYRKSLVIPNIHTTAQIAHRILLNERVFTSTIKGGFQLCDNTLARKYFPDDQLIIAETPDEFQEKFMYFKTNPAERLPYITKMQANILQNHTYHNRIQTIYKAFGMECTSAEKPRTNKAE